MLFNPILLGHLLVLITNVILILYTLPQIFLNYRLKSGTGISDAMLLGMLNMSFLGFIFVYTANMPVIYKIMSPIATLAILIMIIQRIYYNGQDVKKFLFIFLINLGGLLMLIPIAAIKPALMAFLSGWASFAFQFVYQIPQIVKIIRARSTYGFSFAFVSLQTFAYVCELLAGIILGFPWPVIANDIRAILMYLIFVALFKLYPA